MYTDGSTCKEIATKFNLSYGGVYGRLQQSGIKMRTHKNKVIRKKRPSRPDVKNEDLISMYATGLSCREIGNAINMSGGAVHTRLRQSGIKTRSVGDKRGENSANWHGGIHITTHGYLKIYYPDHPRAVSNYVFEHVLVWEETNKKPLPDGWIVHHMNGIKNDNRPENLTAMVRKDHSKLHLGILYIHRIQELEAEVAHLTNLLAEKGTPA